MDSTSNAFVLDAGNAVESTVQYEAKAFTIDNNAHMFKALSSSLYTDKILAVIREYRNNAIDANKVSGSDKPIVVHMPTQFEPWFSVSDYGPGLHPDEIQELFTTYGASNKRTEVDQIGGFGLGSKSAFAYTDVFTVVSRIEGKQYIYQCSMSEQHLPVVQLVEESVTDQPNGLMIKFNVDRSDFHAFQSRYQRLRKWCDHEDELNVQLEVDKPEITDDHGTWFTSLNVHRASVLLGNILYPINWDKFPSMGPIVNYFRRSNIVIRFHPKGLAVTPSREDLSYDKTTVENIKRALKTIVKASVDELQEAVSGATSEWDMYHIWHKKAKTNDVLRYVSVRWNYQKWEYEQYKRAARDLVAPVSDKYPALESFEINTRNDNTVVIKPNPFKNPLGKQYAYRKKFIYVESLNMRNLRNRVRHFMIDKDNPDWVLITGHPIHANHFFRSLGNPPVIREKDLINQEDLRALQKADPKPRRPSAPKTTAYKIVHDCINSNPTQAYKPCDIDMSAGGKYIKVANRKFAYSEELELLFQADILQKDNFVAVPKNYWSKFDEADNWEDVTGGIARVFSRYVNGFAEELRTQQEVQDKLHTTSPYADRILNRLWGINEYVAKKRLNNKFFTEHQKKVYRVATYKDYVHISNPVDTSRADQYNAWVHDLNDLAQKMLPWLRVLSNNSSLPHRSDAEKEFDKDIHAIIKRRFGPQLDALKTKGEQI